MTSSSKKRTLQCMMRMIRLYCYTRTSLLVLKEHSIYLYIMRFFLGIQFYLKPKVKIHVILSSNISDKREDFATSARNSRIVVVLSPLRNNYSFSAFNLFLFLNLLFDFPKLWSATCLPIPTFLYYSFGNYQQSCLCSQKVFAKIFLTEIPPAHY
mgnify:CR=1 FL=1